MLKWLHLWSVEGDVEIIFRQMSTTLTIITQVHYETALSRPCGLDYLRSFIGDQSLSLRHKWYPIPETRCHFDLSLLAAS